MYLSIALADGKIPFVYLNQYFSFKLVSEHEVLLDDRALDFDQLQFEVKEDQILIRINDMTFFNKSEISVYLKDSSLIKKSSTKVAVLKNSGVTLPKSPDLDLICFVFKSQFTEMQACKQLVPHENPSNFQPRVLIDGQTFPSSGIVVLKNKDESVLFQAQLSINNLMELRTKKRSVVPKNIQKSVNQEEFKVVFQDLEAKEKASWTDTISVSQSYFNIELDPILNLKQDIYFTGAKLKESSFNYVRTEIQKPVGPKVFLHNTTFEPFGIYQGAAGTSSKLNVTLTSDLGKGLKIDHRWLLDRRLNAQVEGYAYQTTIMADSANLVNNTSQFLFSAGGGASYQIHENFDLLGEVIIRKDLFFKVHDQTTKAIDIISGLNKILSVIPRWTFYRNMNSSAGVDLGIYYLLPTTADSEAIQAGSSFQVGLNYSYEFRFGHLKFESYYLRRAQNTQSFNFSEQTAFYGLGYQYFF